MSATLFESSLYSDAVSKSFSKKMGLFHAKCKSAMRLDGKTAIITGSNTGIGKVTAIDLFRRGACVIMACRDIHKATQVVNDILEEYKNDYNVGKLEIVELNLCSLKSVKDCSNRILAEQKRIDLLINNAGVMCCPYGKTEDGYEIQFGTNHLGHFLLTLLLLPKVVESRPARIINVSSIAHKMGHVDFNDLNWEAKPYKSLQAYQQSKLCNILFTKELDRRLKEANIDGVNLYSLHPGLVATELGRHFDRTYFPGFRWLWRIFGKTFIKTPEEGAQTTIYCAVDESAGKESGLYYSNCKRTRPSKKAENMIDAKKLWEISLELVNMSKYNPFMK